MQISIEMIHDGAEVDRARSHFLALVLFPADALGGGRGRRDVGVGGQGQHQAVAGAPLAFAGGDWRTGFEYATRPWSTSVTWRTPHACIFKKKIFAYRLKKKHRGSPEHRVMPWDDEMIFGRFSWLELDIEWRKTTTFTFNKLRKSNVIFLGLPVFLDLTSFFFK